MPPLTEQWGSVRGVVISAVLQAAQVAGVARDDLMRAARLDHVPLVGVDELYPVDSLYQLYRAADELGAGPDIGLNSGRIMYLQGLPVQLYMTTISRSFREYLNVIPNTIQLVGELGQVLIGTQGDYIRLEWHPVDAQTSRERYLTDQLLVSSAFIVNTICAAPVPVLRAEFSYPEPEDTHALAAQFGESLSFNRELSCLYLPRAALDYPLIELNYALDSDFMAGPRALVQSQEHADPFLRALRQSMQRALPGGTANIDSVSRELGISRRTLQRRLSERDTNFKQLLQALRFELAGRYLTDARLGITEIGFLLGYSDQASFSNAFRLWHGCSPSEFRQQQPEP